MRVSTLIIVLLLISCSKSERPTNIIGSWKSSTVRQYVSQNGKIVNTGSSNYVSTLLIKEDGTYSWELLGQGNHTLSTSYEDLILDYLDDQLFVETSKWNISKLSTKKLIISRETNVINVFEEYIFKKE